MNEAEMLQALVDKATAADGPNFFGLSAEEGSLLYTLAYHLYESGKYEDSKQIFRFLTICEPFDRRFWLGLAASYQLLKDYAEAIECYSVAAVQEPNDPYVHLHAADCFFAQSQMKTGVRTLESAITAARNSNATSLLMQLENMRKAWNDRSAKN
ncbi:MAG: SycD/LcrH family type III secretion system chaperone [Parachlamydiaceae bacterium]|nr:SycD/LcrH family type III secretion system chaperone [Parachlamydiaceae bacterium]